MNYFEEYQGKMYEWVQEHISLIEEVIGEKIISVGKDEYTEGIVVKSTVNNYWFGWSWKIGGKVYFNDWGNGTEGEIYPDGLYKIERYDA